MGISITSQDKKFLGCLADLGALTNEHMQKLCYSTSLYGDKSARRRTRALEREGLITSFAKKMGIGRSEKIFVINQKMRREVSSLLGKERIRAFSSQKNFNVEHQLLVNTVIIEFIHACEKNKNYLCEYITDLEGASGDEGVQKELLAKEYLPCWGEIAFIPDAAMCLTNTNSGKKALCILEIDRGTTTLKKLHGKDKNVQSKISAYLSFWKTDNYRKFDEYFNYEFSGFRLLWITETQKRLRDVLDLCVEENAGDLSWFTTVSGIREKGAFGAIWTTLNHEEGQKIVKES